MALDQPGETMYAIIRGTVRVEIQQKSGDLVILAFLGPGDTVGEMSVLEDRGRRVATVVTMEPCRLLWLDRISFQACLETMPRLSINLLRVLSRRLQMANELIQMLATMGVPGRVARQLAALAQSYGEAVPGGTRIPLYITQQDLADVVGASRERVNQVVVELKQGGYITMDGGRYFVVKDPEALLRRYS
jgi:CRP/FNR family cyclic AMP-dependent transcriptional regulator